MGSCLVVENSDQSQEHITQCVYVCVCGSYVCFYVIVGLQLGPVSLHHLKYLLEPFYGSTRCLSWFVYRPQERTPDNHLASTNPNKKQVRIFR